MSSLATPPIPPHFHEQQRLSPTRSMPNSNAPSNPRKRKASPTSEDDQEMSSSPQPPHARLPHQHAATRKRTRPNLSGRPLNIDRLLETLDRDSLRTVLRTLSDRIPQLRDEIVNVAPTPSVNSTIEVLRQYLNRLHQAFPLDPNPRSDYCYDRVRPQWNALLDALTDFTPHFLPPNEPQSSISLSYLDAVTQIIHELPEWDTAQYNISKQSAYQEISKAWVGVIKEVSKRAGGIQLQYGGWEAKLRSHNQKSNGLMQEVYDELAEALGWLKPQHGNTTNSNTQARNDIRNQLFSGTYGMEPSPPPPLNMRTGNGNW